MLKESKTTLIVSLVIMLILFSVKTFLLIDLIESSPLTRATEYICFVSFIPLFWLLMKDFIRKGRESISTNQYSKKLNDSLIFQSRNEIFYMGYVSESAKSITKQITDSMDVDRASIWIYSKERDSIICQQLYIKEHSQHYQGVELFEKDFPQYFKSLIDNPIIIADDAEKNEATSCFTESYLKPLGIRSMLDVPIWYKGTMIGVICIESLSIRKWRSMEVSFSQILSSLYSFGYSMSESNDLNRKMKETENFIDKSSLISITDENGKITYVNKKFEDVSGWKLEEALGKDHNIVNSGEHPKSYWKNMYRAVLSGNIWNDVVTNRTKIGDLYYVDTYIRAKFDVDGKLEGFISIRQDVTEVKKKEVEIRNRMNAINKSNAVIEFDLYGNIIYANDLFVEALGYDSNDQIEGRNHKIFMIDGYENTEEYKKMWESLRNGNYFSGKVERKRKDGRSIHLQATYNPIVSNEGKTYRIMKIATDITESVNQKSEIEKKNSYLEHAAKILRHDMHSGINTYIPRGLSSLERRLTDDQIKELKIEAPLKMIKEGLKHSQKVYKGVYEFTNLVKKDVVLNRSELDLKNILGDYLSTTAYKSQVILEDLGKFSVNEALFCTAIDNLIRNGLKYNDSLSKMVKIYRIDDDLFIEDNGRGMTGDDFKKLSQPYTRKEGQKESGTGLGLNICIAILEEHNFSISCEKMSQGGTRIKIRLNLK